MKTHIHVLVVALAVASCVHADQQVEVPATLKVDPVRQARFGGFIVRFEKTTLAEIRKAIGSGSIAHKGDAGKSVYSLCYSLPDQVIRVDSHGEMGGLEHRLTGISASLTDASSDKGDPCPKMPRQFQPVSFDFGWIGTPRKSLVKTLGQPSGSRGNTLVFHYHQPIHKDKQVIGDVTSRVETTLANDKVISLKAWRVTSY